MKIRQGFVSNSSSSSFIIIGQGYTADNMIDAQNAIESNRERNYGSLVLPDVYGKYDFGWEVEDSYSFLSKLNFCFIQTTYLNGEEQAHYQNMLKKVLAEDFHLEDYVFDFTTESGFGPDELHYYIDHQSASYEGENMEMFESEDTLRNFLYSHQSYIHTDNDNRSRDDDEDW